MPASSLSDLNFRDLGGLRTADGRRVRAGLVYRCEGPASFDDDHRSALRALQISTVCDLRSEAERLAAPNGWCDGQTRLLDFDMNQDLRARGADGWAALRADPSEQGARRAMEANYAAMPAALAPFMPALFGALAEARTPLLMHCTAGKDRTGVAIAVLLLALGVGHDDVVSDYLKSDVFRTNLRIGPSIEHGFRSAFGFMPSAATMDVIVGTDPRFLEVALDACAPLDRYLADAGVSSDLLAKTRERLLEEAAPV